MSYLTHRGVVVARNGVVAASQPLAVTAGIGVLQRGGTFVDAAIATSAVLAVTEPYNSHVGGDAFVITYDAATRRTMAYNASGAAPALATPERFPGGIPLRGLASATVPGLVSCWFELHSRHGKLAVSELLAPAFAYAELGFPAGMRYSAVFQAHAADKGQDWFPVALRQLTGAGAPPAPGTTVRQPDLAWTLGEIATGGRDAFYDGAITERMVRYSERNGGLFSREDFRNHATQVTEPIATEYRGHRVHGQPPVSQGHILLQELNLLEGFDARRMGRGSAELIHHMVEAKKLAFADRAAYLGDPAMVDVPVAELLTKDYASRRRGLIDPSRAACIAGPGLQRRDTTYFCVADRDGNAISFIQSVFHGFGCGAVADGTGVLFNNRMTGFTMDSQSPNALAPGKRPVHTLNAYVITNGDRLAWVGGTPGGDIQVQSNFQVISNVIDFGMNPQEAIEAPRWQHGAMVSDGGEPQIETLEVEDRAADGAVAELRRLGHRLAVIGPWAHGSSYQLIQADPTTGAYLAGSDPRCDGQAAGI